LVPWRALLTIAIAQLLESVGHRYVICNTTGKRRCAGV
jgi:hypothetical protein